MGKSEEKNDGVLWVAEFCEVVKYNKELYPNGVKKYKVAQDKPEPSPESDKE